MHRDQAEGFFSLAGSSLGRQAHFRSRPSLPRRRGLPKGLGSPLSEDRMKKLRLMVKWKEPLLVLVATRA